MRLTITLFTFFTFNIIALAEEVRESAIKDIVLLNSYHPTFKWTNDLTFGVVNQLQAKDNFRVSIEFMDAKRFQSEEHLNAFGEYLAEKYKAIKVDGIICSDNHAFEFFLKYGKDIWGDVPMTFCGVNNIYDFQIDTLKYKGVEESINMKGTLDLITNLQPNLDTLIVISDPTLSGIIFLNQFIQTAQTLFPKLNYVAINAISVEQLGIELKKFNPANKAIYLLSLYIPRDGISRDMIHEAEFLLSNLDVPVYGNWNFLFGDFIVGGVIMGGYDQGTIAAKRLKEILNGKVENISYLAPTPEKIIFDYPRLIKYRLNPNILPDNTEFINRPESFLEKYKRQLTIGLMILGFLMTVILVLLRIISLKNIAEKRLQKSESRLALALEGANLGLWDVDFVNKDVFLSSQISELLEHQNNTPLDLNYYNWKAFFHPEDIDQLMEAFQMHSKGIIPSFKSEIRIKTFDGDYKWFSMNGKIIETENDNPARMIGVLMNINFQKEFEEQLRIAKEKAEESDHLKSSFLANMSHEIRTPMNAILGFTDLILNENVSREESLKYLKLIQNSGESLLSLINDIIDFSKIQSGQLSLRSDTFDLNVLVDNITLVANALIERNKKSIRVISKKGSPNDNFLIVSDPFRLEQVIYNLVNNAIKFTESGEITIGYRIVDANTLVFTVKDTGKGIAPEHHELIFERFRQVETSSTDIFGGTGLGLAITRSLLSLMGGKISVESELNRGATFHFTITYKPITMIAGIHF